MSIIFIVSISCCINEPQIVDKYSKYIGIKEYTHEELVNKINIFGNEKDKSEVYNILQKTDNNTLKFIKSVTIYDTEVIKCGDNEDVVGCANTHYINNVINYGDIDVVSSKYYGLLLDGSTRCSSFEHTLNHEIGHIYNAIIDEEYDTEPNADRYSDEKTTEIGMC